MTKKYKLPKTYIKGWYLGNQYLYKSNTERVKITADDWRLIYHSKPLVVDHAASMIFDKYFEYDA